MTGTGWASCTLASGQGIRDCTWSGNDNPHLCSHKSRLLDVVTSEGQMTLQLPLAIIRLLSGTLWEHD